MNKIFYFLLGVAFIVFMGSTSVNNNDSQMQTEQILIKHQNYNTTPENISIENIERQPTEEPVQEPVQEPVGRWVWAKVTAYTPGVESCGIYADGKTSIGVNTKSTNPNNIYGLAVDPRDIPYGTYVYIPKYWESLQNNKNSRPTEMMKADDTGSAMRKFKPHWKTINGENVFIQYHIDVRYRTVNSARNWGIKYIQVFIYE